MKKRIISSVLVVAMLLTAIVPAAAAETPTAEVVEAEKNVAETIIAEAEKMTFPADGSKIDLYCPACEKVVTWEALGSTTWWGNVEGKHGYLATDMIYSQQSQGFAVFATKNTCLHLNGHDLTVTDASAIGARYADGVLNIMGNGTVSGAPATMTSAALRVIEGATINLYGGTYTKGASTALTAPVVLLGSESTNGTLNIYGNTVIDGGNVAGNDTYGCFYLANDAVTVNMYGGTVTGGEATYGGNMQIAKGEYNLFGGEITRGVATDGGNIQVSGGTFNMYGGSVTNGDSSGGSYGGNINISSGEVNIEGGTISNGVSKWRGGNIHIDGGSLEISGGTITGGTASQGKSINIQKNATISGGTFSNGDVYMKETMTISGDPVIETLTVAAGKTFTVGTMKQGASVGINGSGILSTNGNLQTSAQYFYGVKANGDTVIPTKAEGKLSYAPAKLSLSNGTGWCAACGKNVSWSTCVWTNDDDSTYTWKPAAGSHGYLAEDKDVSKGLTSANDGAPIIVTTEACLHLNGKNIDVSLDKQAILVGSGGDLSVLGSGIVTGRKAGTATGSTTIHVQGGGKVNLYGGTYRKAADSSATAPLIMMGGSNYGTVNIYGNTVLDASGTKLSGAGGCIWLTNNNGAVNLYGGTLQGGTSNSGGNVRVGNKNLGGAGTFTMYGGTITGGDGDGAGGNVYVSAGLFDMKGGTITGGNATNGGNIYLLNGEVKVSGGVVQNGTGNYGANIIVNGGTCTVSGGAITGGNAAYRGGNVYAVDGMFKMEGGIIEGGTASRGGNLYVLKEAELSGGTIAGAGNAGVTAGVFVLSGSLTLKGTANVTCDSMQGNIYVDGGVLNVDSGWTGKAGVTFKNVAEGYGETVALGTSTGDYSGTLINELGLQPNIYGVDGKLVISGEQVCTADSAVWAKDAVAESIAASGSYIKLYADKNTYEIPADKTVAVDVNGKSATFTGNGTLQGMDSANDTYAVGTAKTTAAETVTVEEDVTGGTNANRYIAIKAEDGTYSFHRLNIYMSAVSLRTGACGIYYKAMYECDSVLAGKAKAYGVVVSVNNMPGADFLAESEAADNNRYTVMTPDATFGAGAVATSGSIFNMMKTKYDDPTVNVAEENARRAAIPVYANPYVLFDLGGGKLAVGDDSNAGMTVEDQRFDGVAYSLNDVMEAIDEGYASYNDETKKIVDQFYFKWAETGMNQQFANIGTSPAAINADLNLDGENRAFCPVCRETVTWTEITEDVVQSALEDGKHYYLKESLNYTERIEGRSGLLSAPSSGKVCVHLNGQDLTVTKQIAIYGGSSVVNVMGNGTVTGYTATDNYGAAVQINNLSSAAAINLYGGIYTKTANSAAGSSVITSSNAGGDINIYPGVTVNGGTGKAVATGYALKGISELRIEGADINGIVYLQTKSENSEIAANKVNTLYFADSTADAVQVGSGTDVTLAGTVKIDSLEIAEGTKIALENLTEDTQITVSATGVFTKTVAEAETYAKYFKPAEKTTWVVAYNKALCQENLAAEADITALDAAYANRNAYHGEMHNHSDSGATSDGHTTLTEWKEGMENLGIDFATIVDHHMSSHMRLDAWDMTIFVGGSEAAATIVGRGLDPDNDGIHYNMIFSDPDKLVEVVKQFPEFAYVEENPDHPGYDWFGYAGLTRERMMEVAEAVLEAGGFFVHVHPKYDSYMVADDPMEYLFAEYSGIEIFTSSGKRNMNDKDNEEAYQLWMDLLAMGKKVYATAGNDNHTTPDTTALTTIYSTQKHADNYVGYMHDGDFTAGAVGIRMMIGDATMGGETDFAGQRVVFSVGDFHESAVTKGHKYRVELYDETGVVAEAMVDPAQMNYFAYDAKATADFYRVVVWDETAGIRIAVGNPIWNS